MTVDDIEIVYPPCTKTLDELIEDFNNLDKAEIFETINLLRIVKNGIYD